MSTRLRFAFFAVAAVMMLTGPAQAQIGEPPASERRTQTMAPRLVHRVEPEFTPEALEAGISGIVVVAIVVRADGSVEILNVTRGLGYGLDEKAVECVQQWEFRPGTRDGAAVDVRAQVEVNFRRP